MRFESFASSSHGNAYLVSDGETHILLECGLSHRRLKKLTGFGLSKLSACLVSHEHKDHARCVTELIADGVPVYMSEGTAEALDVELVEIMRDREQFCIGTMDIVPFATFHDAREPLGFLIKSRVDGESLAFATDTVNLAYQFRNLTLLAIEANYDENILEKCERMPEKVRHRITRTHLEISRLCRYLHALELPECREIFLLHLSDATSHEGHFINKVKRAVPAHVRVTACNREVKL